MFRRKPKDEPTLLDQAIAAAHNVLDSYPPHSPEYAKTSEQLSKLYAIRDANNVSKSVSPDTAMIVGGNLLGILVIVMYEQRSAMTSKALGFVGKAIR